MIPLLFICILRITRAFHVEDNFIAVALNGSPEYGVDDASVTVIGVLHEFDEDDGFVADQLRLRSV